MFHQIFPRSFHHKISSIPSRHLGSRRYSKVIMRGVPSTMFKAISMSSPSNPINMNKVKQQHDSYVKVMESIVHKSIQLPSDDKYPDCVFIEDTAIVIDDHAVICRIGTESRRDEVDETKRCLLDLGLTVFDMREDTKHATCDGGDVLYPVSYHMDGDGKKFTKKGGKYLFVGVSSRTNNEGVQYLQNIFPNIEVIPIELGDTNGKALHLKSVVTHIDESTLIMPDCKEWDYICTAMDTKAKGFTVIRVPDIAASNVVSVNGFVIAQPTICDESKAILKREVEQQRAMALVYADADEFAKYDGALSCLSILIP